MPNAIRREVWQDPAKPVLGPARKATFQQGVVHYEGVNRDVTPRDIPHHLRQMQASYLASRGYSLGYGFAVVSDVRHPDDGSRWEIRGGDLNMASNPGRKWAAEGGSPKGSANNWTGSVLLIGPTGVRASGKAAAAVRSIFSEWHAESGTVPVRPFPHMKLDYTSCCGQYVADLQAGLFDPSPVAPPPPPIQGVPDMFTPIAPYRNSDTRAFGGKGVPAGEHSIALNPAAVPKGAVAVAVNVVAIPSGAAGFMTVWPSGPRPNTSIVNYEASGAHNGAGIVGVADSHIRLYQSTVAHFIVDITGYWTP